MDAFAERAGRELRATGETARKRTAATARDEELTAQEAQIARLALALRGCRTRRSAPGCAANHSRIRPRRARIPSQPWRSRECTPTPTIRNITNGPKTR